MNEENIDQISESTSAISNWSVNFLEQLGFADKWINYINLLFLLLILMVVVVGVQYLTRKTLTFIFSRSSKFSRLEILGYLLKRKFPNYLAMFVTYGIIKGSIPIVFELFPKTVSFMDKLVDSYLVYAIIMLFVSVIKSLGDMYKTRPRYQDKPIDSYIQVVNIIFYSIAAIVIFSILTTKEPSLVLGGLGAASAILMLIFKDTILGFVASIQVTANDMVRIGDWISMPQRGADGDVEQITLTTVKVRNFDKTITTLPPYSLVTESFQNWRGMAETGGRRIKRSIFIKQSTVRFINDEEIEKFKKIDGISQYIEERKAEIDQHNSIIQANRNLPVNGRNLTNLGVYREYLHWYLKNHPSIHKGMTIMVRQLAPSSSGLPLEVYAFTNTTEWIKYEDIISDIFDHSIAALKYFDLEVFEDISQYVSPLSPTSGANNQNIN